MISLNVLPIRLATLRSEDHTGIPSLYHSICKLVELETGLKSPDSNQTRGGIGQRLPEKDNGIIISRLYQDGAFADVDEALIDINPCEWVRSVNRV